jgi:coenzyme PQQ precursor peptide PqqA
MAGRALGRKRPPLISLVTVGLALSYRYSLTPGWGALQRDGGFRAALLLSGGINDGVAESHRCVATSRGPPTSPRAAPNARGFFFIRPRAALFVSKRGNKGAPCRVNSPRASSTGPATRRRNDAMAWSTPEIREVCVGMEVTRYQSAEM